MAARYEHYVAHGLMQRTQVLIPKIIHQIWLGSPLPEKYKQLQKSWLKYHPDWHYYLWTEKEIAAFGLTNQALYDATSNYGEKSDIARYEIYIALVVCIAILTLSVYAPLMYCI